MAVGWAQVPGASVLQLLHQAAIGVLPLQELGVLQQRPLPEHQDLVSALNGLQPVSDHQHCAVPAGFPVLQLKGKDHNASERLERERHHIPLGAISWGLG